MCDWKFLALFLCLHAACIRGQRYNWERANILNLNFQLPLRYREFIRLHSVRHSSDKILAYFHIYSPVQGSAPNDEGSDVSDVENEGIVQEFSIFSSCNLQRTQSPVEGEFVCPLELSAQTSIPPEEWSSSPDLQEKMSPDLLVQPRLYCLEISKRRPNQQITDRFEFEIFVVIRVPVSNKRPVEESSDISIYCHANRFTVTQVAGALLSVEGINFVKGYLSEQQHVRLADLHLSQNKQKPSLVGTVLVGNYCYEKKVTVYYGFAPNTEPAEMRMEAEWRKSPNQHVDEFVFEIMLPKGLMKYEMEFKCLIQRIEYTYYPSPHHPVTVVDDNNGVGYAMLLNTPFERLLSENTDNYVKSAFVKEAYKYYPQGTEPHRSLSNCRPEMLTLLQYNSCCQFSFSGQSINCSLKSKNCSDKQKQVTFSRANRYVVF